MRQPQDRAFYDCRTEMARNRRCEGLDPNVVYLTTTDVMRHTGLERRAVHYHVERGHLKTARPGGPKTKKLFHPDEVKRFKIEYLKEAT